MLHNPYKIVKMFEEEVAHYAGAPFAVSTDSCTNALLLCCEYLQVAEVTIPAQTYLSVPQSIIHAGGMVTFDERKWNLQLASMLKAKDSTSATSSSSPKGLIKLP